MNLFDLAKKFFIVVDKLGYEEVVVHEPNTEGTIVAQTMLSEDEYKFDTATQADLWDNGKFYVKTLDGEDVPFIAYRKVNWQTDLTV